MLVDVCSENQLREDTASRKNALLLGIYSDEIPSTDFVLPSNKDRATFLKDYQTYVSEYVRQD